MVFFFTGYPCCLLLAFEPYKEQISTLYKTQKEKRENSPAIFPFVLMDTLNYFFWKRMVSMPFSGCVILMK
jgi:hypothetical protein